MLGVFLNYSRAEFGLAPLRRSTSGMRTGFSHATTADDADDDYDLSWRVRLPEDRLKQIRLNGADLAQGLDCGFAQEAPEDVDVDTGVARASSGVGRQAVALVTAGVVLLAGAHAQLVADRRPW